MTDLTKKLKELAEEILSILAQQKEENVIASPFDEVKHLSTLHPGCLLSEIQLKLSDDNTYHHAAVTVRQKAQDESHCVTTGSKTRLYNYLISRCPIETPDALIDMSLRSAYDAGVRVELVTSRPILHDIAGGNVILGYVYSILYRLPDRGSAVVTVGSHVPPLDAGFAGADVYLHFYGSAVDEVLKDFKL